MSSGGGGDTNTKTEPWDGQKDALNNLYNRAAKVTGGNLTPYGSLDINARNNAMAQAWGTGYTGNVARAYGMSPGDLAVMQRTGIAPLTKDQNAANAMVRKAASAPLSRLYGDASTLVSDTLKGKYLSPDSNPYLKQMAETANRRAAEDWSTSAMPALTAQFSASGRYGSGAQERVSADSASKLQQNMLDNTGNLYGNAYEAERGRQQQAIQLAPGIAEAPVHAQAQHAAMLANIGNQQQALQQGLYGNLQNAYGGKIQAPYNQLQAYGNIVNGTPSFGNQTQQGAGGGGFSGGGALGGAAAGAAMGSMFMPGWGTAGGALAGGLFGGFF